MTSEIGKPPPLTAALAITLEALRGAGAEVTALALARRLGLTRSTVFERLCRLELFGFATSRRGKGTEGHSTRVFQAREGGSPAMQQEWEYDPATRTITTCDATGHRELIAIQVKPRHARIIFGLIELAHRVASCIEPNPFGDCKRDCACLTCESRRLLAAIGGGE